MPDYGYTSKNLLEEKESYQYSKYYGASFLDAFFENRTNFLNSINENTVNLFNLDIKSNVYEFLKEFYKNQNEIDKFMKLLQKFEVTKRIFDKTDENFRRLEDAKAENLNLYSINAILKCNDILVSQKDFSSADTKMLKTAIENEIKVIKGLRNEV